MAGMSPGARSLLRRPLVRAATVGLLVFSLHLVDALALEPLRERGVLDGPLTAVHVVVVGITLPGVVTWRALHLAGHLLGRRLSPNTYPGVLALVGGTSALCAGLLAWWVQRRRARAAAGPRPTGRRAALRRAAGWGLAGGLGLLGVYATFVEPRWPRLRRLRLPLRGLPAALDRLRVVQLTDLHLGPYCPSSYLARVIERVNELRVDLVLLTGDYIHGSHAYIPRVGALLARLRSRWGALAVLGNHDHWEGAERSRAMLRAAGARVIENTHVWISSRGVTEEPPAGGGLCVAGIGDLWEGRHDLDAALGGVDPAAPRLLLSHNPDFAESGEARRSPHRIDLMLAGHTHGGQVRIPGVRARIVPSSYGVKYAQGLVAGPRFPVYVSAGIGLTILPFRFLVPPEITLIELTRG